MREPGDETSQQERPPRRRSHPARQHSVLGYLVILFAVAFLLLLMAYFQQQRLNSEATSDAMKQSASAVESLQNLMEENKTLREQVEALQEEQDKLRADVAALTDQAAAQSDQLKDQARAMDLFWQIDEAFAKEKYALCRELIQLMEGETNADGSKRCESLPRTSTTDNGRFSPYDRYQEICDALY